MKKRSILLILLTFVLLNTYSQNERTEKWSLVLHQPGKPDVEVLQLPDNISQSFESRKSINGIDINFTLQAKEKYAVFKVYAISMTGETSAYFSLQCNYSNQLPYNFNGEVKSPEIYRQSPHDTDAWIVTNIAEQAIPVVAIKSARGFTIALNSTPADYDNFTSQYFYPGRQIAGISSGDNGETPGLKPDTAARLKLDYNADKSQVFSPGKVLAHYHLITPTAPHVFEGLIFSSRATNLNELRKDINYFFAVHFSGGKIDNQFGALAFTTAYMNTRVNETGKSKYWVVPSVEYGNTQYCRDAFWISTMLAPGVARECLNNELQEVNTYAEYPLITIIWAYTAFKANTNVDLKKVQAYVDAIEQRSKDGFFYSFTEKDGRLDFQYWGDVIAFEKDDVITYNQGLFALALVAAKEMGLKYTTDPAKAIKNYREMFNPALGFYPISKKKNMILGPDPLVPDLLAQLYFKRALLDSKNVNQHFEKITRHSKTAFGYKVVSMPNGDYLPPELYDIPNYKSQVSREKMPAGSYFCGGSFFLYDNLFLMDAYLHGIKEAENELIWRTSLDFKLGATTYECINTKTGEPWKPNMGWNVAIYACWKKIIDMGLAGKSLFNKIDIIMDNFDKH
ncbi:MAG: hypothetical protein ABIS01_09730 [Ferruginibacter sp.]